jgi:hypothetical protein
MSATKLDKHPCVKCPAKQTRNSPPYDRVCFCWELNRYLNNFLELSLHAQETEIK